MTWTSFQMPNLDKVIASMDGQRLLGEPLRRAYDRSRRLVETRAKSLAPGQGIAPGIRSVMDSKPIPMYSKVHMPFMPTGRNGFRYPMALDASRKVRYHYRSGPHQGKLTRRWWRKAMSGARASIFKYFGQAMDEVGKRWRQ